jgi:hypothetical protein
MLTGAFVFGGEVGCVYENEALASVLGTFKCPMHGRSPSEVPVEKANISTGLHLPKRLAAVLGAR